MPVTISNPTAPIGTYLFTAGRADETGKLHWLVQNVASGKSTVDPPRTSSAAAAPVRKWWPRRLLRCRRPRPPRRSIASRSRRSARPHRSAGYPRRFADRVRPRHERRNRQGHRFHHPRPLRSSPISVTVLQLAAARPGCGEFAFGTCMPLPFARRASTTRVMDPERTWGYVSRANSMLKAVRCRSQRRS